MRLKSLLKKIEDKKIILLGEVHGTKEIPFIVFKLLKNIDEKINFCLEIPKEFQEEINLFIKKGTIPAYFKENPSDGRNSVEILKLIRGISNLNKRKGKKINIFCVDEFSKTQEKKEKNISKNILSLNQKIKTIVLLGEIHASIKEIDFGKTKINPVGKKLKEKINNDLISIRIKPLKGKYFNFGIKKISKEKGLDSYFDTVIYLNKVRPCSFIRK